MVPPKVLDRNSCIHGQKAFDDMKLPMTVYLSGSKKKRRNGLRPGSSLGSEGESRGIGGASTQQEKTGHWWFCLRTDLFYIILNC